MENTMENNGLGKIAGSVPTHILTAIRNASVKTGVDFAYLVEKASAESNFNPAAKARSSSATGLFQFIEKTWMKMVRAYGDKYGLSEYAHKIDENGQVADDATRRKILNMRKDPTISSYMAAEFASDNERFLRQHVGGEIGPTELYFAHFMGAGGSAAFLNQLQKAPSAIAADLFPREAMSNRNVFYDPQTGKPRTMQQVYNAFDHKFTDKVLQPTVEPEQIAEVTQQKFHAEKIAAYKYVMPEPLPPPVEPQAVMAQMAQDTVSDFLMDREKTYWQLYPSLMAKRGPLNPSSMLTIATAANYGRYND